MKINHLSMGKKIIIAYILLVVIPMCTLVFLYYRRSSDIIEKEVTKSFIQALKQSELYISNKLYNIQDISDTIFMDTRVRQFLTKEDQNVGTQLDEAKEMKWVLEGLKNRRDSFRIRIFVGENKMVAQEKVTFFSINDAQKETWYKEVLDNHGGVVWIRTYTQNYLDSGEENIISCARILKHSFNYYANDGVLLLDLPETSIYEILSNINLGGQEGIYIVDRTGAVIAHKDKSRLGKQILEPGELEFIGRHPSGLQTRTKEKGDVYILHETIGATGWKVVAEIDREDIIKSNRIFNSLSAFILIIITFAAFVFGLFLLLANMMDRMNRQVKKLLCAVEEEGVEVIDDRMISNARGDFPVLEKTVYSMISKVKTLMEESFQARLREREAQLQALQAQINPHFLYNTLDTINWMAIKMNAPGISFLVNSLAKYFRLSLSKGKDIVSIRDELELAKVYLIIQQTRFKGAIQYEFKIDSEVENYNLPKLTLQPIIENAILHGIQKNKDRSGMITVEAKKVEDMITFTITDNGIGMDRETIEKVLENLPDGKKGSYGLHNVYERIKLFSGAEAGIKIESEKGQGTRIELKTKAI